MWLASTSVTFPVIYIATQIWDFVALVNFVLVQTDLAHDTIAEAAELLMIAIYMYMFLFTE